MSIDAINVGNNFNFIAKSESNNLVCSDIKKPDFFYVHIDANGTSVIGDTTKKVDALIGEVSGVIKYEWVPGQPKKSYKEYVQQDLFPGNKYDTEIKALQEEKIGKFLVDLKEANHPLYEKAFSLYTDLVKNYVDPETQKIKFTIFPSVIELIDKIKKICACSVTMRTFGFDGDVAGKEFTSSGIEMTRHAQMLSDGVKFEGEETITAGPELLKKLEKANTIGQDQVKVWFANDRKGSAGKVIPCVEDAIFEGRTVIALFLDDNYKKSEKTTDSQIKPADPNEQNIAFPKDVYGRSTSWDSKGIIAIRVNTIKAALQPDYLVKKVNKQLAIRGIKLLS